MFKSVALLCAASLSAASIPVDGDIDLLRTVRDANAFVPPDRLAFRYEVVAEEGKTLVRRSRGLACGDGDRRYRTALSESYHGDPDREYEEGVPPKVQIFDGERLLIYNQKTLGAALLVGYSLRKSAVTYTVHPEDLVRSAGGSRHFYDVGESSLWTNLLDPDDPDPRFERFEVAAAGDDVTITCYYKDGGTLTANASLALDGVITSYQMRSGPAVWQGATFYLNWDAEIDWKRDSDGTPLPTRFHITHTYRNEGSWAGKVAYEQTNTIEYLDRPAVPGAVFDIDAFLKTVEPGTVLHTRTARNKHISVQKLGEADREDSLDRLADDLAADGFGADDADD